MNSIINLSYQWLIFRWYLLTLLVDLLNIIKVVMSGEDTSKCKISKSGQAQHHFIGDYETAPAYMKDNDGITHGYRINFNSPKKILKSLFMFHNESVNIWTHCIPAILIILLLTSFFMLIDGQTIRKSMNQYQQNIQKGLDHYMHAIDNLSLITKYDTLSQFTKDQMEELKQTVMKNYQEFTNKFNQGSYHFQNIFGGVQDFKSNVKETLKTNLAKFERAKVEFQQKIAPMLVSELNTKLDGVWVRELKETVQKLKNEIDSDDFQYIQLHQKSPNPHQISRWPIMVFLASAAVCLLSSTLFHLFYPMSSKTYTITNRFDYAGVNILISGSTFPPIYYGMYCQLAVATIYLTFAIIAAVFCFTVCLFQWIHRPGNEKYKAFLFGGYGLTNLFPLTHLLMNELFFSSGDTYEFSTSIPYYILIGCSYLGGLYVYTVRCPQRNNPGKYNLCGHSHQIWHVMVVLGILFTYMASLQSFQMRKVSTCPA